MTEEDGSRALVPYYSDVVVFGSRVPRFVVEDVLSGRAYVSVVYDGVAYEGRMTSDSSRARTTRRSFVLGAWSALAALALFIAAYALHPSAGIVVLMIESLLFTTLTGCAITMGGE